MKVAIIAGEASGDILGSRLIQSLKSYYPDATFEGIGGREMLAQGFESHYSMERLSVMGFAEVFSRLFELLKMRGSLKTKWLANPPDIFIGIDAPDFNLELEKALYQAGIPTVHYVSPSVWAWRENRVKKMKNAMDLMLTLFPFEVSFYEKHQIPAKFVGHPLADEIAINVNQRDARNELKLPEKPFILSVLPGSRIGEIKRISPDFLAGLKQLHKKYPDWKFVVPVINEDIKQAFLAVKQEIAPDLPMHYINGQSRTVMAASDQVLMASGTAVLEGMLVGRPMVAAYRVAPMTAKIIRLFKMIKSPFYTLPNNLADEYLVPELIQEELIAENVVKEVEQQFLMPEEKKDYMLKRFNEIHLQLKQNASDSAAKAIHELLENKPTRAN